MRGLRIVLALVVMAVVASPPPALAGGRRHHGGTVFVPGKTHPSFPLKNTTGGLSTAPVDPWKSWAVRPRKPSHVPDRGRSTFVPFFPFAGSTAVVTSVVASPTTIIYEAGYDAGPPGGLVTAAAVPPVGSLVEYPEGWYQLHGDGFNSPYRWVWIPRPPPAPIAAIPPATASALGAIPAPEAPAGPRIGDAYHWTDEQGVTSWTNRPDRIPRRYRDDAVGR